MNSLASRRLRRRQAGLLVVDIQEKLLPAMAHARAVVENAVRLAHGAVILGLPLWVTEQYRKGLGPTVPEVASAISDLAPTEKLTFSAAGAPGLSESLSARGIADVILCGIEAHVCVCQTALDLLDAGRRVWVVADATSSRTPENHRIGLERMRDAGAQVVSTEMVLFELLERAGTDEFKQILRWVK